MDDALEIPDELDETIRAYLNEVIVEHEDNDEMLTEYFIVAATRTFDNGGQTFLVNKHGLPTYILEGMLRRALWLIN